MDVRCERCRAQYVFDDEQVTPSGLTVQCTNCGHVFKVKKKELVVTVPVKPGELEGTPLPANEAGPKPAGAGHPPAAPHLADTERPREWRVRQANGNVFTFRELTTLQKWIVEQKVSRDDEISLSGDQWKRLGNIAELASFFQVVEAAERAKAAGGAPAMTPIPMPAVPVYGVAIQTPGLYPPPPSGYPPPAYAMPPGGTTPAGTPESALPPLPPLPRAHEVDLGMDEPAERPRKGRGARTTLLVVLLGVSVGAAAYLYGPRLLARKAPPPDELAVPITIEVKPDASPGETLPSLDGAPPEPGPAPAAAEPVRAPEAIPVPALHGPPDPVVKPATESLPAPRGPKALLAQAGRLRDKGNARAALDAYGRVLAADPRNVEALTGRGLCYLDLSSYAPAEASFQAALEAEPDEPDALLGLAETYRWQGKKAEAISSYERYLARHPDGEEAAVARNALEELRK